MSEVSFLMGDDPTVAAMQEVLIRMEFSPNDALWIARSLASIEELKDDRIPENNRWAFIYSAIELFKQRGTGDLQVHATLQKLAKEVLKVEGMPSNP